MFRRLVQGVTDYAIFLLTPEGNIASWNAGAERIKGYTPEEAIGRHFSMFYAEEAVQRGWPQEELRRATALGRFEDEGWRVRKDGSQFWANVVISAVTDEEGRLLGFSKVTRDLTERREQERRLQESEEHLRLLIEGVQDYAIFSLDEHGVISSWNLGAQRIKGYSAQEAIGQHFSIFYPPEAVAAGWPKEELRRAALYGRYEDEGWRVCKNGSRIWANVVITAIRDRSGKLLGFSKVTRDTTQRRMQQEQLKEREENLRSLVENVKDHAMFLVGVDGRIKTWNTGAQRVFGYIANDVVGQSAAKLYAAEHNESPALRADLSAVGAAGFSLAEGWRQRSDGSTFWAETSLTALYDTRGQVRGYTHIVRDLTERKRVEKLEAEGRRISDFIAMLSHELRNPLAPIRNAVSVLGSANNNPSTSWCVDMIGRQVSVLTDLIDDLLDVSRVTSGKIRIEPKLLELNTLLGVTLDSMRAIVTDHQHVLVAKPALLPVPVMGDSTRLTQLISNLVTNAAKYTPAGGRIEVSLRVDGKVAILQVADNGIGMSESLLQTAFDPFVQGERSLSRSEGGMGIGLTLVRRIAELHGGSVAAASAGPGKGSTITVTLPVADPAQLAQQQKEAPAAAPVPSLSRRVLLVDDNRDAAESLAMLLRIHGHEVQVAYDGQQALDFATSLAPAVVLLDIGLPGMNGLEVCKRIRALPFGGKIRVVALTGYGQGSDREASRQAGFDSHMVKPVDVDALLRTL